MATGVIVSPDRGSATVIDNVVLTARAAHEAGVRQVWLPQNFDYDALALAALLGLAGRLKQQGGNPRGRVMDLMIAATALSLGMVLVARNPADVDSLGVELLIR